MTGPGEGSENIRKFLDRMKRMDSLNVFTGIAFSSWVRASDIHNVNNPHRPDNEKREPVSGEFRIG